MKKNILIMVVSILLIGFVSCKKDQNEASQANLDASKTTKIKKGEPVSFKLNEAPDGSNVTWSVTPSTDVKINSNGNTASILFSNAGSFTINASYGTLKGNATVSVQDSIYNPGSGDPSTNVPLTGDQIFVTVSKADSMGLSGLVFKFVTGKKYKCLNNTLLFDNTFSGQDLKIDFKSVFIPSSAYCSAGEDYASSVTSWYPIEAGSHSFSAVLDGKTYTGSFVKSGSTYTFTWPYTTGVIITPLVIN
jgi:hypothetical protein